MMRGKMPEPGKPFVILALRIVGCAVALDGIIHLVRGELERNETAIEAGVLIAASSPLFFAMARIVDYLRHIASK